MILSRLLTRRTEGAAVQGRPYLRTNAKGYAVFEALTPYRQNFISLDVSESESDVALLGNRKVTVPYRGAVVVVDFETETSKPFYFWRGVQMASL